MHTAIGKILQEKLNGQPYLDGPLHGDDVIESIMTRTHNNPERVYEKLTDEQKQQLGMSKEEFVRERIAETEKFHGRQIPQIRYVGGESPGIIADTYLYTGEMSEANTDYLEPLAISHEIVTLIFYNEKQHTCTLSINPRVTHAHTKQEIPNEAEAWKAQRSPPYEAVEDELSVVDTRDDIPPAMQAVIEQFSM